MSEGTEGAPFVIQSRQRSEDLRLQLPRTGLVGVSDTVASNAVRAQGYNAVVGLVLSDVAFTVEIQGASGIRRTIKGREVPGEWTTLESIASAASGARQRVVLDHEVRADYIRIRLVNGATGEAFLEHGVRLIPIFSFKRVEVVSGGGDDGAVEVAGSPGDTVDEPANTALGIGATAALPSAPAGTRRVRVQATGGDDTTEVLIRGGGVAGRGILLDNNGSTLYGGADGAIADLEAENLAGPAVTIRVQWEED